MPQSGMKIRHRRKDMGKVWGKRYTRTSRTKPWVLQTEGDITVRGVQITESEGHPFQGKYGKSDVGGPFSTVKVEAAQYAGPTIAIESTDGLEKLVGIVHSSASPSGFEGKQGQASDLVVPVGYDNLKSDVNALGSTAIALCAPANPLEKLNTTLAEVFKEGLPSLPGVATWKNRIKKLHKSAAGEHLNVQFAILPLLEEMKETAKLVRNFAQLCEQYKRDEGRLVRREFHFKPVRSESSSVQSTLQAPRLGSAGWSLARTGFPSASKGTVYVQEKTERITWFSGAFRYHIPDSIIGNIIGSATGASEFIQNLLGNSLTPELLWELTPWSWAIDYFSNAQQVLTNLQRNELYGLFMAYGYLMDENIKETTYTWQKTTNGSNDVTMPGYSIRTIRKDRVKANPYGFGISWDDLSPLQIANLTAAGISRLL